MKVLPIIQQLNIRNVNPAYIQAFEYADSNGLWATYNVNTAIRIAHFLAQVLHESGGLSVLRENMSYTESRIMQIFGVNRHSAAVTQAEAKRLARNPEALAERVYGLGNPRKARELGNTRPGDGWLFRGGGLLQTTGGGAYKSTGDKIGVDLYSRPELITQAAYAILPALIQWKEKGLNALADQNNIREITRRVNGGYNGYDDRVAWFNKSWALIGTGDSSAWEVGKASNATKELQKALNILGASPTLEIDGKFGPATERAVRQFQTANNLKVDGIAGDATWGAIRLRLEGNSTTPNTAAPKPPSSAPEKTGISLFSLGLVGDQLLGKVELVRDLVGDNQTLQLILGVVAIAGLGLIVYGLISKHIFNQTPITE